MIAALREAWARVRSFARGDAVRRELDDEMRFHLDSLARDFAHAGISAADARLAARRRFGGALSLRERSTDAGGLPRLDSVVADVRFGARMLRRSPGFAGIAIGAIAMAIGVNCAFFTIIDAIVFEPLAVADPSRLVHLRTLDEHGADGQLFSYAEYADLQGASRRLDGVTAFAWRPVAFAAPSGERGAAIVANAACVSGNYFSVLGAPIVRGRALLAADDSVGAPPVIVISQRFWEARFGAARDVVGRSVLVNGRPATIVGVARRDFIGIQPRLPDFWMPVTVAGDIGATPKRGAARADRFLELNGRLRAGVTRDEASAELSAIVREPERRDIRDGAGDRVRAVWLTAQSSLVPISPMLVMLAAPGILVVVLVLVIACANLATLLLARALVRQREIAVRMAVGASRARMIRQLLTESVLIAASGALLGIAFADWGVVALARASFGALPPEAGTIVLDLHAGWRVLAYATLLVVASVVTFGLAPALQATAADLGAQLKGDDSALGTRIRKSRLRDLLVAAQVAASVVVAVAAGILVQSARRLADAETGMQIDNVLALDFGFATTGAPPRALVAARDSLALRVRSLDGVRAVALVQQVPFTGGGRAIAIGDGTAGVAVRPSIVAAGYFDVVGQRMLQGRDMVESSADSGLPQAVITAAAARALWPGRSALGETIRLPSPDAVAQPARTYRVTGVVSDARTGWMWERDESGYAYLSASRTEHDAMTLLVRTERDARDVIPTLRRVARDIDPALPLRIRRLTDVLEQQTMPFRQSGRVATGVGAIALLLACVGLYGVVAFAVRERRREVAVHVAMGATRADVLRLVMRRELRLVLVGAAVGVALAAVEARLFAGILIPLAPLGALGFALVPTIVVGVAVLAMVVPALAALRIEPMRVLRQE